MGGCHLGSGGIAACLLLAICPAFAASASAADPFPSTYQAGDAPDTLIVNVTILDGDGSRIDNSAILLEGGKIAAVGADIRQPGDVRTIDGRGRWVTPGLIDVHSHNGQAALPYVPVELQTWDVNEATDPNTAHVWAEHAIRPGDPAFARALAGGVTTLQILPGSRNLFGGRGVVVKNVPATTVQAMKFPDAPPSLKMACGENPKYTYGLQGRSPATRMGIVAAYREAWESARTYGQDWEAYRNGANEEPPARDLRLETLSGVLTGDVRVHVHCYRAEEMAIVMDLAEEYGFQVTAFHHAVEAYKIPRLLGERGVCGVVWSDWWGFKMEAFDGVRENAAFLEEAGACVALHSDSPVLGQHLNMEAAKAAAAGRRAGIDIAPEVAIRWLTGNPARVLGLDDRIGTIAPGKNADIVIWSGDPFSIAAKADFVFIDGVPVYERQSPVRRSVPDFELGQPGAGRRP